MSRRLAFAVSLLLAGCVVAGATAAVRTARLGQHAPKPASVPDAVIAARAAKLDRWERALAQAREAKPPALPKVPRYAPVVVPTAPPASAPAPVSTARAAAPPQQQAPVTYVQAPPVVHYQQAAAPTAAPRGDDEGEHDDGSESESGGDD